jgi:rhomboid protease GluP
MNQVTIWLMPIAISAVVALIIYIRMGVHWTWGLCLQQLLILGAATAGFLTQPADDSRMSANIAYGIAAIWAGVGWALFFIFNVGQRTLLANLINDLSFLRPKSALARSKWVPLLVWGPPSQFWIDMAHVINDFSHNDRDKAEALISKWNQQKLPASVRESLAGFSMLGRIIIRDWQGIVDEMDAQKDKPLKGTLPYQMANRAYAELGRFDEAVDCLDRADLPGARIGVNTLDTQFMTFFSVAGAIKELTTILTRAASGRHPMPEYARTYWLARCHSVRHEDQQAIELLEKCKETTPANLEEWHTRIDQQIARTRDRLAKPDLETAPKVASEQTVRRAQDILDRSRLVSEIVRPSQTGPACSMLITVIIMVYGLTNTVQFMSGSSEVKQIFGSMFEMAYTFGPLNSAVFEGQWWRLLTYQFLHAPGYQNISHLVFNILALMWFGKLVENMYGTSKFVVIYFGSGVLSGLAQVLLSPQQWAVGASGAIMGIFGAGAAGMLRLKNVLPKSIRQTELYWMFGLAVAQIVMDQVVNYFAGKTHGVGELPHIASYAHIGGMVAGFVLGMIVPLKNFEVVTGAQLKNAPLASENS